MATQSGGAGALPTAHCTKKTDLQHALPLPLRLQLRRCRSGGGLGGGRRLLQPQVLQLCGIQLIAQGVSLCLHRPQLGAQPLGGLTLIAQLACSS